MPLDSWTRRVISAIELESSSEAAAAERTCSDAVSEAPADWPDRPAVVRAVSVSCRATRSNSPDEASTLSMMPPTLVWNSSTKPRNSDLRCSTEPGGRGLFLAKPAALAELFLKISTVRAISPISSIRSWYFDLDAGVAVGNRRQRLRDRGQRLGDAAHDQQRQDHHQKCGDGGGNRHVLDRMRQHRLELGHRNPDIENADTFPAGFGSGSRRS